MFRIEPTNWPDADAQLGFKLGDGAAEGSVQTLSESEYASKRGQSAGAATATRIHTATQKQPDDKKP